jgi:mono/diheme cytochrome c family protein
MKWIAAKPPSPQPSPQGEGGPAAALWSREENYSGVPSPLEEKDRVRGDSSRAATPVKIGAALAVLLLAGCDLSMTQQPKYTPETPSQFWANGASARPIPAGTVAQGDLAREAVAKNPPPVTLALLNRGQQRFEMFCSPCHGLSGYGDGMVVQRGFPHPPSFYSQRLLAADVRHFFNVQTKGFGVMYSYAGRVSEADRWAIAAYIRALQVSQHATLAMAPEAAEKVK